MCLEWFWGNRGVDVPWPKGVKTQEGETLLASKTKGIYKPSWSRYALSVRQTLGGPYPDRDPVVRKDKSWLYSYFQENDDPKARDDEYTNRGLIECWKDRIPVGVMRQVRTKPNSQYRILGLAIVAGWDGGYFFLEGFSSNGTVRRQGPESEIEILSHSQEREIVDIGIFDPNSIIDARERVIAGIIRRRGQPEFRRKLLIAYENRCAITRCDVEHTLEAAHITPYNGPETNHVTNGLLLRADIHTLFDLGLLSVDHHSMTIILSPKLFTTFYSELQGARLYVPKNQAFRPNIDALRLHREWSGL